MKNIDLLSEIQSRTFVALSEAYFRERNAKGEVVFELLLWTHDVTMILTLFPDYESLHPRSVIFQYNHALDYELDGWGEDTIGEVELERLDEFLGHLKSIHISTGQPNDASNPKAYAAIIELCESALANGNRVFFEADYFC